MDIENWAFHFVCHKMLNESNVTLVSTREWYMRSLGCGEFMESVLSMQQHDSYIQNRNSLHLDISLFPKEIMAKWEDNLLRVVGCLCA